MSKEEKQNEEPKPKKKARHAPLPPSKPWLAAHFRFEKEPKRKETHQEEEEKAEEVEKGLEAIYLKGEEDDLGVIRRKKRRRWVKIVAGVLGFLFLLSLAVWAGFYFIDPYARDTGGGMDIAIQGSDSVTLGKQETFTVHWVNQSRSLVRNAEIRLSFPAEFTPTSFEPVATDEENHIWNLGMLSPGEQGSIVVKGVFLGRLGNQAAIQALGTYERSDGTDTEELVKTFALSYDQTILETSFNLPPKLVAGDAFTFDYVMKNVSEDKLGDMEVRFEFPKNFLPSTSGTELTAIDAGSGLWSLPLEAIEANATSTVNIHGVFTAGTSGDQTFKASVGRQTDLGEFLAMAETETQIPVLSGDLGLQFVVNGSDENRTIQPGDTLRVAIGYENLSPEDLGDIELELKLETLLDGKTGGQSFLSWQNLEDRIGGASSTTNGVRQIVYSKEQIPVFGTMAPNQTGSIDVGVPTLPAQHDHRQVVIRLTLEGRIKTVGEDTVNRVIQSKPIELTYRSDADLSVEARYFLEEGAPIGSGPLPPIAGQTTRYRVYWDLTKQIHELENVTVEATLPNIAAWANRTHTDAGELRYDEGTRTVRWELNKMPQDVDKLEGWFEIDVTPSDLDVGRFAAILGETKFNSTDTDVHEGISRSKPPLSTDLQNDEGAKGKGVVRAAE